MAFGRRFKAVETELAEDDPPIESLGPLPDEGVREGDKGVEPAAVEAAVPAVATQQVEIPRRAAPPPETAAPPRVGPSPWAPAAHVEPIAAPPQRVERIAASPEGVATAAPDHVSRRPVGEPLTDPAPDQSVDETAFLSSPPVEPALPFGDSPSPSFLASLAKGADELPHQDAGETSFVDAVQLHGESTGVDETAFITDLRIDDPMPFDEVTKPPPPPTTFEPSPDAGRTGPVPLVVRGEAVPYPREPVLSLEQYASLRAELIAHPQRRQVVLSRYHVNVEQFNAIANHWSERCDADPALKGHFEGLVRRYLEWLNR